MSKNPENHIGKHKRLYKAARGMLATISHEHDAAYIHAKDKHLRDKDGNIDMDLLDDTDVQEKFAKSMSDHYISKAKQHFKSEKKLNKLEKDMLMRAYSGTTESELKGLVTRSGSNLTSTRYRQSTERLMQNLTQQVYASAGDHIKEDHIEGIVKHVGLEDKLNVAQIDAEEAKGLLQQFHEDGAITDTVLKQIIPSYKVKKKKKKKKE